MGSYNQRLQRYTREFEKATDKVTYSAKDAARWLIENGLWKPPDTVAIQKCADDLTQAWREEYTTDPQGRRVRKRHAFSISSDKGKQLYLWGDWERLNPKQMTLAFQGRRKQIVGECRQLKNDVDSYNQNQNKKAPIPMSYNFTLDLQELESKSVRRTSATAKAPLSSQFLDAPRRSASERVLSRP